MKIFLISLSLIAFVVVQGFSLSSESCPRLTKIVPLTSTCDDIKQILNVKECNIPLSTYKFDEYTIAMSFSDGEDKWNVPKWTVLQVHISLKQLQELDKYLEENKEKVGDFTVTSIDDLPGYQIYANENKGIELTVIDEKLIQNIVLRPRKNSKAEGNK